MNGRAQELPWKIIPVISCAKGHSLDEKRLDSTAERLYNDMKKKSITIALAAVLAVGLGSSVLFSAARFGVANPFSVLAGLYQVGCMDTAYVELQQYPKVMLAKPATVDLLIGYMESQGYAENPEGRTGSILEFEQSGHKIYVDFSVNRCYSLWQWRE